MKETLNLLPRELAFEKRQQILPMMVVPILIFLFSAVVVLLWAVQTRQRAAIEAELARLTAERTGLQARIAETQVQVAVSGVPVEQEVARETAAAYAWPSALRELSLIVPHGVWLSLIDARSQERLMTIKGYAMSQIEIAAFIGALERSSHFSDVEIVLSQRGTREIVFELRTRL